MKSKLEQILKQIIVELGYEISVTVIPSNRPELCDYQCDDCFKIAKAYHKSPLEVGNEITKKLEGNEYFKEVTFVAPGFINMTLSDDVVNKVLNKMMNQPKFGICMPEKEETYVLDYGGYNIAKPLHIGHLRPTIIGESIKRIISYMGHHTISDVHLGDYGLQMGQVIYGILRDQVSIEEINIDYLNHIYPEISLLCKEQKEVQEKCANITKELQEGDPSYTKIWDQILKVSIDDAKGICNYLGVSFDLWQGESDSYQYLNPVEAILNEKKLLEQSEGAEIIHVKKETDNKPMPPMMFRKSNGAYVYDSTDLATIYERAQKYHPDHILYVTDFRQNLHFEQVFRASDLAEIMPYESLEHTCNGTINGTDGKPFKTRKGDAPKLRELFDLVKETFITIKDTNQEMDEEDIDIIVNAIIKFADLQNGRDKDYIFDVEKFSQVVGKTGPYMLYTYLRLSKLLEKDTYLNLSSQIYNEEDRKLRLHILKLEPALQNAFEARMPSIIADYIYDLALLANTFYQKNHIQGLTNETQKQDWLSLVNLTRCILKELLNLIIIDIPKFM